MALAKIARVGDTASGTCSNHTTTRNWTGQIQTGSPTLTVEGSAAARIDDTGNTSCGHTFKITEGSSILEVDGRKVARIGDAVIIVGGGGSGTITGGASTTQSE